MKDKISTLHKKFYPYTSLNYWQDVTFAFIFREIAFVLLPLVIIFVLQRYFTNFEWNTFFASTDFAFATIVLICSGIFQFVELKVKIQGDKSEKLQLGLKYFVIFLVLSCILMTITILKQLRTLSQIIPDDLIGNLMKGFMLFSFLLLFIKVSQELKIEYIRRYGKFKSKEDAYIEINENLDSIIEDLNGSHFFCEQSKDLKLVQGNIEMDSWEGSTTELKEEIIQKIHSAKKSLDRIEKFLKY
ncbi:hypothetical protein EHQ24_07945 [Leptospira noumeaensis]|uniref:Uncharacterized protein n=1 Tax=Leptospira noumeaensis TaxID=2484964 RepID=A0A4R9I9Q8_9LEPT|nr:hypothetical protein [Leptospira noumeaensis]TGK83226.1 hypothetical protein EHQ24_07945 [Leptospira noumeaensis]